MLACALGSLLLGVLAGLARSGVAAPIVTPEHVGLHAVLMFGGFFGTVISLERAVALGRAWGYLAPGISALAAVSIWLGAPAQAGAGAQLAAGIALLVASWSLYARQPQLHALVLVLGAACWPAGSLAWIVSGRIDAALGLWFSFLVLTIAGERLELSRFMPPAPRARRVFVALMLACLLGSLAWALWGPAARPALGAAYLGLAAWLVRQDIARRTARERGLTGFIGRSLLSGYVWLAAGAALMMAGAAWPAPLLWDAAAHAILLGFVMAMVFGHAPIIFPAVLRVRMPFHASFYIPLILLHLSMLARLAADLAEAPGWRGAAALGNALALAAFLASTVSAVARGRSGIAKT